MVYFRYHCLLDSEFLVASSGTTEYTLTKRDVGRRLKFIYIPFNLEGLLKFLMLFLVNLM